MNVCIRCQGPLLKKGKKHTLEECLEYTAIRIAVLEARVWKLEAESTDGSEKGMGKDIWGSNSGVAPKESLR